MLRMRRYIKAPKNMFSFVFSLPALSEFSHSTQKPWQKMQSCKINWGGDCRKPWMNLTFISSGGTQVSLLPFLSGLGNPIQLQVSPFKLHFNLVNKAQNYEHEHILCHIKQLVYLQVEWHYYWPKRQSQEAAKPIDMSFFRSLPVYVWNCYYGRSINEQNCKGSPPKMIAQVDLQMREPFL